MVPKFLFTGRGHEIRSAIMPGLTSEIRVKEGRILTIKLKRLSMKCQ